ncbi:MAG: AraC family transcriptional regulator [Burkholderiales bacterium]|nr:AraC family transcriptional regulator [Burkholderiales bacterium]
MSQDILSDVLRGVRLRGAVFFYVSGHSDWAAEAPPGKDLAPLVMQGLEHVIEYHAVATGSCWAGIPGGPSVQMSAGDVVMFPQGDAHFVASRPGLRGNPDVNWFANAHIEQVPLRIAINGGDIMQSPPPESSADTTIVCGFIGCDLQPFNPLIAALPRLLHLRAEGEGAWMATFAEHAVAESRARRLGGEAMLARMSETMFVDAVRRYVDHLPERSAGWLAGLRDRFVSRALALLHESPARDWSIEELGRRVGMSRSALHDRFVALIGVPPMTYLLQWRMQMASRLLLDTRATVAAIALDVGYESEAAFARAFKREVGQPPATWRRARDAAASLPMEQGPG